MVRSMSSFHNGYCQLCSRKVLRNWVWMQNWNKWISVHLGIHFGRVFLVERFIPRVNKRGKRHVRVKLFAMTRMPRQLVDRSNLPPFKIYGKTVCKDTYLYLIGIPKHKNKNLAGHYSENGLVARRHNNKGRLTANTTQFETVENVKSFITSYGTDNALALPGRVPGCKDECYQMISSSASKKMFGAYTIDFHVELQNAVKVNSNYH